MDRPDSPEDRETIPHAEVTRVLIERAEFVRSVLLQAIQVIADPRTEVDATSVAKAAKLINSMHCQLFAHERARPWLMFVRCIDHAARQANQVRGAEHNPERAKTARALYRRSFPEFERNLDDLVVERAVSEWRKQPPKGSKNKGASKHWVAIHDAVKCFMKDPPQPESMSKTWREDFPHLSWDSEKTKQ